MTGTRRVDELEVGDRVVFPHRKEPRTVSSIKPPSSLNNKLYVIHTEETQNTIAYIGYEKVIHLGNNKKEENTMKVQKVNCSALYPYFDSLANDEASLKHTNIPVYVRQQLKNIYELFEDVLGLTLEEVKALYFERKMSKEESNVSSLKNKKEDSEFTTKKAKELCIADEIVLSTDKFLFLTDNYVVKISSLKSIVPQKIRLDWEDSYIFLDLEEEVKILKK